MNRWTALGLLILLAGALVLRLPQLGQRPYHNDEAVNAIKFQGLWEQGTYRYDPQEHHGPTLPYASLVLAWLTRAPNFIHFTDATLRLAPLVFGVKRQWGQNHIVDR
jgi:predicted membrane-bound mannosyltransferase